MPEANLTKIKQLLAVAGHGQGRFVPLFYGKRRGRCFSKYGIFMFTTHRIDSCLGIRFCSWQKQATLLKMTPGKNKAKKLIQLPTEHNPTGLSLLTTFCVETDKSGDITSFCSHPPINTIEHTTINSVFIRTD